MGKIYAANLTFGEGRCTMNSMRPRWPASKTAKRTGWQPGATCRNTGNFGAFGYLITLAFDAMDTNGDGVVDENDGEHGKAAAAAWGAADGKKGNDDGKLNVEEALDIKTEALFDLLDSDDNGFLDATDRGPEIGARGDGEGGWRCQQRRHAPYETRAADRKSCSPGLLGFLSSVPDSDGGHECHNTIR